MFRNYLIVAFRNFKRNYVFTAINILGLTLGLAIGLIILLYLVNELTYDKYHKDSENIYRLFTSIQVGDRARMEDSKVNAPLGPYLLDNYEDVITQARISDEILVKFNMNNYEFKENLHYADSTLFDIFTYKFLAGNKRTALKEPFSMVITESISHKYFGDENPVGKIITDSKNRNYTITAVIKNVPENSHFKFDILSSFSSLDYLDDYKNSINGWGFQHKSFYTYIKVKNNYDISILENEFPKIATTYLSDNPMFKFSLSLQAIEKIHLHYSNEGSISRIILFGIIGILILLIPCINYMNLNTAESIKRLKEVGVRKVVGAQQRQLVKQFLSESVMLSILSLILAITLAEILLPTFNTILNKNLSFNYSQQWMLSISFVLIALLVGIFAGSYPAFYLSSFNSRDALQGKFVFGSKKAFFRNVFIVLQFAISIFLICCTAVIFMQLRFTNKKDLGLEKDNVIVINLYESQIQDANVLKEQLLQLPEVGQIAIADAVPFISTSFSYFKSDGIEDKFYAEVYNSNSEFIDLFNLKIVKGRKFDNKKATESENIIVNETFVKEMNWKSPIGKTISTADESKEYNVIGVVKDFHRASFHEIIHPCILGFQQNLSSPFKNLIIKVKENKLTGAIPKITLACKNTNPEWNFELQFLDQEIKKQYEDEYRIGYMFMYFAILAIFITSIGLYGLALFIARQRTKEIGIRKIFGSSISSIIKLLVKQFVKILFVALLVAIPAAWYYSEKWLQDFAFKFDNRWTVYVFATIVVLVISFITIIYQSAKAAFSNPINAIKYE